MDFSLNEEQGMFRGLFQDFAQGEVAKVAEHVDKSEEAPISLLKKAAAQGFLAATMPEDLGGAALDPLSYAMLIEEIAKVCMSTATTLAMHNSLVVATLVAHGNDDQKERWLPGLAESIGAFALTEPEAGSDKSRIATRACLKGDTYVLDGVKTWVSNAGIAKTLLVVAQTEGGPALFAVETETPGIKLGHREPTMGIRGVQIHTVYFDGVQAPVADRVGAEGEGLSIAEEAFTHLRLAIAAAALGCAERALDLGRSFAVERKQFGVSISTKPALGNYFADTD